jgi:hypothetical protein
MSGKPRTAYYGYGKWPRKQLYAIVGEYRRRGSDPEYVAKRLGVGLKFVRQIFSFFEWEDVVAELEAEDIDGQALDVMYSSGFFGGNGHRNDD